MSRYAGGRHFRVTDDDGTLFPLLVMYPSPAISAPVSFGPYTLEIAANGEIEPGRFPLVVISHGSGGTHLGYRELASRMACAGFLVLMPEHPGNNRHDNTLAESPENLRNRPRHISRSLDLVLGDGHFGPHVDESRVAMVGHSMGGYTALVVAGGRPTTEDGMRLPGARDDRVKALVLLAPATPWFMADGALADVRVPVLMLTGEHDTLTPRWQADLVRRGLPADTLLEDQVIPNAGHFSFMSPFPEVMRGPGFAPGNDPEGFDRSAFQDTLAESLIGFLHRVL